MYVPGGDGGLSLANPFYGRAEYGDGGHAADPVVVDGLDEGNVRGGRLQPFQDERRRLGNLDCALSDLGGHWKLGRLVNVDPET